MNQTELSDPYLTPRTLPARQPHNFLSYGVVLGLAVLTLVVSLFMVRSANGPVVQLRRNSMAVYNYTDKRLTTTESPRSDMLRQESFNFKLGEQ